jgi:hypothetical protein
MSLSSELPSYPNPLGIKTDSHSSALFAMLSRYKRSTANTVHFALKRVSTLQSALQLEY